MCKKMVSEDKMSIVLLLAGLAFIPVLEGGTDAACGGTLEQPRGTIQSPSYPDYYPGDKLCSWMITVAPGSQVVLDFQAFELEQCDNCHCDFVEVHDGHDTKSPLLAKFCGSKIPENVRSTSNKMRILFRSDGSDQKTGFSANFFEDPCLPNPCKNNGICSILNMNATCKCQDINQGERCEYDPCFPNPCKNGGTCSILNSKANCSCKGISMGELCEYENPVQATNGAKTTQVRLKQYFLGFRDSRISVNKWGPQLLKIAMVLYLSDPNVFAAGNIIGQELAYEVSVQLLSKLTQKKDIPTWQLSQFINSLLVSCINPKDFFGIDVVSELRKRVNNSNFTNPFSILTLCNAKDVMTIDDVNKVVLAYEAHHRPGWTDIQALSTMALACLSSYSNLNVDDRLLTKMTTELKMKQSKNSTIDNLITTALVVQALLAADSYSNNFDLSGSVKYMVDQLRSGPISTDDAYFLLPVLSFKSLANLNSNHCRVPIKADMDGMTGLRDEQNAPIEIQYSVVIGNEMPYIRTWKLKVAANYSFYQVLENVGAMEPEYKVQYIMVRGKPYVSGLSKLADGAQDGMFWFTYSQKLNTTGEQKLIKHSPVDIKVKPDEELMLWYRSGSWTDTSKPDRR